MEERIRNIEEIKKEEVRVFEESGKKCLIRRIENGYIISTGNSLTHRMFFDADEELKKDIEEHYFEDFREVMNFCMYFFNKKV